MPSYYMKMCIVRIIFCVPKQMKENKSIWIQNILAYEKAAVNVNTRLMSSPGIWVSLRCWRRLSTKLMELVFILHERI